MFNCLNFIFRDMDPSHKVISAYYHTSLSLSLDQAFIAYINFFYYNKPLRPTAISQQISAAKWIIQNQLWTKDAWKEKDYILKL